MAYAALDYRPHARGLWKQTIANSSCWHFDAWLYAHGAELYLVTETRTGGRDVLARHVYRVAPDCAALHYVPAMPEACQPVTLDMLPVDTSQRLNALHWRSVYPMSQRRPNGFRYSSVSLHYIRAPSLEPFEPGVQNFSRHAPSV
jgi:hypothetical protein